MNCHLTNSLNQGFTLSHLTQNRDAFPNQALDQHWENKSNATESRNTKRTTLTPKIHDKHNQG